MRTLDQPVVTARDTFKTCISRVENADLSQRLEAAIPFVVSESEAYAQAAARYALHEVDQTTPLGVTRHEMEIVYTSRMVGKKSPGRATYELLRNSSPQGICPLCSQRVVTTLDHVLPKFTYPTLVVTPLNLVPSCSDCNKAKLSLVPAAADEAPLHPYFDEIDYVQWLSGHVLATAPAALVFEVRDPGVWSPVLLRRVINHFKNLGLGPLYSVQAAQEVSSIRHQLVELFALGGMPAVRLELEARARSALAARLNGWRAATYQALAESDWFCSGGFI